MILRKDGLPPLWKHQAEVIARARNTDYFALFLDCGTGKTRTTIEILLDKYEKEQGIVNTLILCPPIVIPNWAKELKEFSSIPPSEIIPLSGPGAKKAATVTDRKGRIVITNYESLLNADLFAALLKFKPKAIVYDEAHFLRSIDSKRKDLSLKLSQLAKYKYILTGTPVLNSLMDVFFPFLIMDGGESFGTNFYAFRAKYFLDKNAWMPRNKWFPNFVPRKEAFAEIKSIMAKTSVSLKKEECLDLPPLVIKTIPVELTKAQRRVYDEMEKDFLTVLEDKVCVAQLVITKALRLLQIASGFLTTESGNVSIKDCPKAKALKAVLEEIPSGEKVIIWSIFLENYNTIREVLADVGLGYVEVTGQKTQKEKDDAVLIFNTVPDVRVIISHPASGGVGVNLTAASYSVVYSRDFNLGNSLQSEARNYRGGSICHEKITRINLVAAGTIDEIITEALERKENLANNILRFKDLINERNMENRSKLPPV